MGLSVDTHSTFKYVLTDKRDLPEDQQPYLVFRYLSARDHAKMDRLFLKAYQSDTVEDALKAVIEGVAIGLVGWAGFHTPFNLADIDDICTAMDLLELRGNLGEAMTVSQSEKKASVSRSLSTSGKSAPETATASA